jgi:hypothetical protein
LATAPLNPAGSKQRRAVSQRVSKRTAIVFNAIAPRRARIEKEFQALIETEPTFQIIVLMRVLRAHHYALRFKYSRARS